MNIGNLFQNKKVLLVGLGRLGGGVATAKFLLENGADLTITDLNSAQELKKSLAKIKNYKVSYTLGEHKEEDFKKADLIIFNQAVSVNSKWVKFALKNKKQIETDLTLFLKIIKNERPNLEYIAVTGTRGKTTTTTWIHHFLKPAYVGGNMPTSSPPKVLKEIFKDKKFCSHPEPVEGFRCCIEKPLILEIPSYQFEYFAINKYRNKGLKAPKVALITNLYVDHLNRHGTMENYAHAKSQIFSNQTKNDFLILNYDDKNKKYFLNTPANKRKAKIFYISLKKLSLKENGLYFDGDKIYLQQNGKKECLPPFEKGPACPVGRVRGIFSSHQKYNLLSALLASYFYQKNKNWLSLINKTKSLPEVPFRQQIILNNEKIKIINDSTATSPEGVIVAIERFKKENPILICGGTDKQLEFKNLAKEIKKNIPEKNLYLLNGTATEKLIKELQKIKYFSKKPNLFEGMEEIIKRIMNNELRIMNKKSKKQNQFTNLLIHQLTILFSPGAASFGKFKNEFDRGEKFSKIIKENF